MNSRWMTLVSMALVVFAGLVITWQFVHNDDVAAMRAWVAHDRTGEAPIEISSSIYQSYIRGKQLSEISDIVKRDQIVIQSAGFCRYFDLVLPEDAHIFMKDMTGPTNAYKILYYYPATYYLFPREVGVSLDHRTRLTQDGIEGRTSESNQEILTNGYDAIVEFASDGTLALQLLRPLREISLKEPATPDWFSSKFDEGVAALLPLLTALAGMWLFRFTFPGLSSQLPLAEQLACALGLGMMGVAAFTLGLKLCGFHGYHVVFLATAAGGAAEIWRDRCVFGREIAGLCRQLARHPVLIIVLTVGMLVFLILFRLAGLQGLVDPDAPMAWALKAKIMHLYTGSDIVQWFSNPRLANAHLDYPPLIPSLLSATYDSLGHVDEFVTKFWPAWMLFFLLAALAALSRNGKGRFYAPYFCLLGVLLLPAIQKYVQMEGGTMPMIFFIVIGFVNCTWWLAAKDPVRLGLGLTFLFGAALCKFEGFIFLALVAGGLWLLPAARPPLKLLSRCWRPLAFCLLAVLPFVCLRLQIPTLNYESNWAGHLLRHPTAVVATISNWARLFGVELARLFVNPDFARWNGEGGQLHWIGRWDGLSSLWNPSTLSLGWLCLFMSVALWFAVPARRPVVVWISAMFLGAVTALSGVFACFVNITSLNAAIGYTVDAHGARYLLPMLLAWFATVFVLSFADLPSNPSTPDAKAAVPGPSASASAPAPESPCI